jgi:hypothetical protein
VRVPMQAAILQDRAGFPPAPWSFFMGINDGKGRPEFIKYQVCAWEDVDDDPMDTIPSFRRKGRR